MTAEEFRGAEQKLLASKSVQDGWDGGVAVGGMKRQPSLVDMLKMQQSSNKSKPKSSSDDTSKTPKKETSASPRGMKRSASFTIESYFSKSKQSGKRIIG